MDRCAVFVDAGYLLGAAGSLIGGEPDRRNLQVDYESLVEGLIAEAQKQTGLPVLRLLWYDGALNAQPTLEHRNLRVLPDVKVRLGELVRRGGRLQQKGVDSYLQRDLTQMARNRAVADVVLIGGDEDLRRALEEAQEYGVRVHLWGVEAAEPDYNQSQNLIAEADRRWVLSGDWVTKYVTLKVVPTGPAQPAGLDASSVDEAGPVATGLSAEPAAGPTPAPQLPEAPPVGHASPADLARLAEAYRDGHRAAAPVRPWEPRAEEYEIPRLRDVSTSRQKWQDNEQDATTATGDPAEAGARFGRRWAERATAEARALLLAERPIAPRHLDGELLRYAEKMGIETWDDEAAKFAVRDAFWEAVGQDPGDVST